MKLIENMLVLRAASINETRLDVVEDWSGAEAAPVYELEGEKKILDGYSAMQPWSWIWPRVFFECSWK